MSTILILLAAVFIGTAVFYSASVWAALVWLVVAEEFEK